MKRLALLILISLFCFTTLIHAGDDKIILSDEFINALGGESAVEEVTVLTRGLDGAKRNVVVRPKQKTIKMNFKFDSTELSDQRSHLQLVEVGKALSSDKLSHIMVEIGGYTDSAGPEEYNLRLSRKRAERIKNSLIMDYGVDRAMLQTKGYGEKNPATENDTEYGRAENRRVVIKRLK